MFVDIGWRLARQPGSVDFGQQPKHENMKMRDADGAGERKELQISRTWNLSRSSTADCRSEPESQAAGL